MRASRAGQRSGGARKSEAREYQHEYQSAGAWVRCSGYVRSDGLRWGTPFLELVSMVMERLPMTMQVSGNS